MRNFPIFTEEFWRDAIIAICLAVICCFSVHAVCSIPAKRLECSQLCGCSSNSGCSCVTAAGKTKCECKDCTCEDK